MKSRWVVRFVLEIVRAFALKGLTKTRRRYDDESIQALIRGKQLRDRIIRNTRVSFETLSGKLDRMILPSEIHWRSDFMCLPLCALPSDPKYAPIISTTRSEKSTEDSHETSTVQGKHVNTSALALRGKSKKEILRDLQWAQQALQLRKRVRKRPLFLFLPRISHANIRARSP